MSQRKSSPNREVVGSNPKWRSSTLAIIDIVPPPLLQPLVEHSETQVQIRRGPFSFVETVVRKSLPKWLIINEQNKPSQDHDLASCQYSESVKIGPLRSCAFLEHRNGASRDKFRFLGRYPANCIFLAPDKISVMIVKLEMCMTV